MEYAIIDKDLSAARFANIRLQLTRKEISPNQAYIAFTAAGMPGDKATEMVESCMKNKVRNIKKAPPVIFNGGFEK